jgi:hypothetical protein
VSLDGDIDLRGLLPRRLQLTVIDADPFVILEAAGDAGTADAELILGAFDAALPAERTGLVLDMRSLDRASEESVSAIAKLLRESLRLQRATHVVGAAPDLADRIAARGARTGVRHFATVSLATLASHDDGIPTLQASVRPGASGVLRVRAVAASVARRARMPDEAAHAMAEAAAEATRLAIDRTASAGDESVIEVRFAWSPALVVAEVQDSVSASELVAWRPAYTDLREMADDMHLFAADDGLLVRLLFAVSAGEDEEVDDTTDEE